MYFLDLLLFFFIISSIKSDESLYKIPIDVISQNFKPVIPIYINEYSSIPKLLSLDINLGQSWIFNSNLENIDEDKYDIKMKHAFYMISGINKKSTIYLNQDIKISDFHYLDVNKIFDEINNSGSLSLNANLDGNNIISFIKFKDDNNIKQSKYFGFCLDITNINKNKNNKPYLYIGDLSILNKDISKLQRFP